jgi:hypothetical protein
MDSKEFIYFRKKLNKTQKQMAQLLGTSLKAIHSQLFLTDRYRPGGPVGFLTGRDYGK